MQLRTGMTMCSGMTHDSCRGTESVRRKVDTELCADDTGVAWEIRNEWWSSAAAA